jgi:hypothetical protein
MNPELKELIKRELPALLREDPALRDYIIDLTKSRYADQRLTDERFDRILQELRDDRIAQTLKWEEQNHKWDEQNRKWDEQNRKQDEQNREWHDKWEAQNGKLEEQNRTWHEKWEAQNRAWHEKWNAQNREWHEKWDAQNREWHEKWEAHNQRFDEVHEAIMAQAKKFDRSIGGLGARWGIQSEKAFRNALAGILEESFGVQVIHVNDYDDSGEVFGRPDQVEIDVIIKNGMLLILELKSSIDKAGMYSFERKARFYEKRHGRQANRLMVIAPMIDDKARKVAQALGIELFCDSIDVDAL